MSCQDSRATQFTFNIIYLTVKYADFDESVKIVGYCESTFIRGVPIFVVFVDDFIHEFKCPTK